MRPSTWATLLGADFEGCCLSVEPENCLKPCEKHRNGALLAGILGLCHRFRAEVSQLEAWVARLHAVPAPAGLEEGPIASLRLAESGEVRADRPLVIVDGPTLPESSRKSFYALGEAILKDALERLADCPLRRALLEVHGCFEMSAKRAEANEATCLCHNDLNLGNVLAAWKPKRIQLFTLRGWISYGVSCNLAPFRTDVWLIFSKCRCEPLFLDALCEADEGEISGVVDWEGAGFTFKDQDLEDLREMGGSQLPDAKRLRLMELLREVPCASILVRFPMLSCSK